MLVGLAMLDNPSEDAHCSRFLSSPREVSRALGRWRLEGMTLHVIALIPLIGRSNGSPRWGRRTIKMSGNFRSLLFVCESSYTAGLQSSVWTEWVLQTQLPTAALEGRWGDPWFWKHQGLHGCRKKPQLLQLVLCTPCACLLHAHPHTHMQNTQIHVIRKRGERLLGFWTIG